MPGLSGLIKVGHKGADHVAPGNTIESFEAALECGVDMIEFDVLRLRDGRLVLAHDYEDGERPDALTLDEGLDHFAGEAYGDVQLDVDLKLQGYEEEVVEGLRSRGLDGRALISSHYLESLDRVAELAPGMRARLVGAQREARLHQELPARRARLRAAPGPAGADPRPGRRARSAPGAPTP